MNKRPDGSDWAAGDYRSRQATVADLRDVCEVLAGAIRGTRVRYGGGTSVGALREEMRELLAQAARSISRERERAIAEIEAAQGTDEHGIKLRKVGP